MKRIFTILMVMILATALFTGCTKNSGGTDAPRTTQAPEITQPPEGPKIPQAPNGELGPLTRDILAIYNGGYESGSYHVKFAGEESSNEIYVKGGNIALLFEADDELREHHILKDGYLYTVLDGQKRVTKTALDKANISYPSPPDFAAMSYIGSGKAEFMGEELDYDEYYQHNLKHRELFFVKDGTLAGIRYDVGGFTNDVDYLVFEKEVPDSVFDIPADYTVVG